MSKNVLMVFAKNPVKGKVKTRLAADIGAEAALSAYLEMLRHTRKVLEPLKHIQREIWYAWKDEEKVPWMDADCEISIQQGGDLGEKLQFAFKTAFASADKVVVIGTDCPGITENHLREAFDLLDKTDAVLGPAEDGGYYLIGMKGYHPRVFEGINWSTSEVAEQSRRQIARIGWSLSELEVLQDIDTEAEYLKWKALVS